MTNVNCLEGMACPKCGHDERLCISCTTMAAFMDDGVDDTTDYEFTDTSYCECSQCKYSATVADFREGTLTFRMQRLQSLVAEYDRLMEKRCVVENVDIVTDDMPCVEQIDKSIDDIRDAVFDTVYDIVEASKE
jgi:hypothetical protein